MKRLLIIAGLVLAVLVGLGAWAYFVGTTAALERAEAFQFRRMAVARVPETDLYRFFYATNRLPSPELPATELPAADVEDAALLHARLADAPTTAFSNQRDETLRFGRFDTALQHSLGLGMWLDAGAWFLEEEIRVHATTALARGAFIEEIGAMMAASPLRSVLVLVHGYRTDFGHAQRATAFMAHILDIDTPVVVFDWPANQGDSLRGYRRAQAMATASGAELAALVRLLVDEVAAERVWLVANSLGAQVVVDAVSLLYQDRAYADATPELDNIILTAPDVDRADFTERFRPELAALADNTTIYVSGNDRALLVSRVLNRGRRLGESSLVREMSRPLADASDLPDGAPVVARARVDDALDLLAAASDRVVLVDVTPVNRTLNFHNFSFEVPEFFDDMFQRLTNTEAPANRLRYELTTPEGKAYSVLTRGR